MPESNEDMCKALSALPPCSSRSISHLVLHLVDEEILVDLAARLESPLGRHALAVRLEAPLSQRM